jgi:hypothetical protein
MRHKVAMESHRFVEKSRYFAVASLKPGQLEVVDKTRMYANYTCAAIWIALINPEAFAFYQSSHVLPYSWEAVPGTNFALVRSRSAVSPRNNTHPSPSQDDRNGPRQSGGIWPTTPVRVDARVNIAQAHLKSNRGFGDVTWQLAAKAC